jgi:NADH dehydrogenase/NADH:ubiquinone oxidoreductase subunit G
MGNLVKVRIDGKEVEAPAGTNLIDAAELAGLHIPNLCYLKGMKGIGACRLCLVEVEGLKAPVIACNTKVKEGMVINTRTEKIQDVRKFVIDLLLSMHPLDCMTCTKAGACNLQRYAYEFELKESSFLRKKAGYPVDSANPFIKRDPDYCVLCGRCVRVCKEQGTNVLDFMGRGVESKVVTANDKPLQESECTFCGSCVDACPVNALLEADRWRKGREWEYKKIGSVCLLCGNACDIKVSVKDGTIRKINTGAPDGSCDKYICAYGRFGFDSMEGEARLKTPLKRVDGKLVETTWEDALKTVAAGLKDAGGNAGFVSTAGILNEDAMVLRTFAKDIVKTRSLDTTMSLYGDAETFINSQTADINKSDLVILVGLAPSQWDRVLPALDAAVRRRVARGAKLVVINEKDSRTAEAAAVNLTGDVPQVLKGIAKALIAKGMKADENLEAALKDAGTPAEEIEKTATLISEANEPLIFSSPSFFGAAANIALLKGKVVSAGLESNTRGVALIGLGSEGKSYVEMVSGGSKVLYVVGEIPVGKRPNTDLLVVQNSHMTELAQQADVVLPSAMYLESPGTIIDYMGRVKYLPQVIEPFEQSKGHAQIFMELAGEMGSRIERPTEEDVKKATRERAKLSFGPFEKKEGVDISPKEFIGAINKSVISGSRLVWLTVAVKEMTV